MVNDYFTVLTSALHITNHYKDTLTLSMVLFIQIIGVFYLITTNLIRMDMFRV